MRHLYLSVFLAAFSLTITRPAMADVVVSDSADEEDENDDDKGCATVVAPASVASLALGVGIVLFQRRREN